MTNTRHIRMILHILFISALVLCVLYFLRDGNAKNAHDQHMFKVVRSNPPFMEEIKASNLHSFESQLPRVPIPHVYAPSKVSLVAPQTIGISQNDSPQESLQTQIPTHIVHTEQQETHINQQANSILPSTHVMQTAPLDNHASNQDALLTRPEVEQRDSKESSGSQGSLSLGHYDTEGYTSLKKLYEPDTFVDQLRGMDMSSKEVVPGRQYDERFSSILKSMH